MFTIVQEALEAIDEWAAEDPLWALREPPEHLTPYRLNACAMAEPLAALVYAGDLLTPERHAACRASVERDGGALQRYVPDRLGPERLIAISDILSRMPMTPIAAPIAEAEPVIRRARSDPRSVAVYTIRCEVDGIEFTSRRADARFCSARCRQKASRGRRSGPPAGDSA